jgi:hypothetical protein
LKHETIAIRRRSSHFLFGLIQSGFTTAVASAIASAPLIHNGLFFSHWQVMDIGLGDKILFVLLATPLIRKAVEAMVE